MTTGHESLAGGRWATLTIHEQMFFDPDPPPGSAEGLKRYFLAFAIAARR
jgi:hypothetical protein